MIVMAVIKSWVLHKPSKPNLTLGDCTSKLAKTLCSYKIYDGNKRRRLSNLEREVEAKKRRGLTKSVLPKDMRTGHNEKKYSSKNRFKLPSCVGFSRPELIKCWIALCHKNRNCINVFL